MPRPIQASAEASRSGGDGAFGLRPSIEVGDEVVHLAHVLAHVAPELRVLPGLAQRLDPELVRMDALRPQEADRLRHGEQPLARVGLVGDHLLDGLAQTPPHLVEAGAVEISLAAEVPVEDRLADARGAGDLGRRRTRRSCPRRTRAGRRRAPPRGARLREDGCGRGPRSCRDGRLGGLDVPDVADHHDGDERAGERDRGGDVEAEVVSVDELTGERRALSARR